MTQQRARAVIVVPGVLFDQPWRKIAELAAKHRLPSISARVEFVEAGGLMSYGQNLADQARLAATYVDKIFKGAKPADLPVQQATKFELAINRKTAQALGLTIPQSLLIGADKVIE
jgi:putative ABC transport system substrate-binding protein